MSWGAPCPLQHPEQLPILTSQPFIELHQLVHLAQIEAFAPGLGTDLWPQSDVGFGRLHVRARLREQKAEQVVCLRLVGLVFVDLAFSLYTGDGRAERMVRGNLRMTAKHDIGALGECRFRHLAPVAFPETSN